MDVVLAASEPRKQLASGGACGWAPFPEGCTPCRCLHNVATRYRSRPASGQAAAGSTHCKCPAARVVCACRAAKELQARGRQRRSMHGVVRCGGAAHMRWWSCTRPPISRGSKATVVGGPPNFDARRPPWLIMSLLSELPCRPAPVPVRLVARNRPQQARQPRKPPPSVGAARAAVAPALSGCPQLRLSFRLLQLAEVESQAPPVGPPPPATGTVAAAATACSDGPLPPHCPARAAPPAVWLAAGGAGAHRHDALPISDRSRDGHERDGQGK